MKDIKEYTKIKKSQYKAFIERFGIKASLGIIQVGNNEASNRYIKNKIKDCEEVGIQTTLVKMPYDNNIGESDIIDNLVNMIEQDNTTSLVVQLPLPDDLDADLVCSSLPLLRDADALCDESIVNPATPQGIVDYLKYINFNFSDCNAVILGRSKLVGKPLAKMLTDLDANVSLLHSKTSYDNKQKALQFADLVVVATGQRNTITDEDFRIFVNHVPKLIVDVGINFNEEGKLVGDCESVSICEKTPVPGGVGLLTRVALIKNILRLTLLRKLLVERCIEKDLLFEAMELDLIRMNEDITENNIKILGVDENEKICC